MLGHDGRSEMRVRRPGRFAFPFLVMSRPRTLTAYGVRRPPALQVAPWPWTSAQTSAVSMFRTPLPAGPAGWPARTDVGGIQAAYARYGKPLSRYRNAEQVIPCPDQRARAYWNVIIGMAYVRSRRRQAPGPIRRHR